MANTVLGIHTLRMRRPRKADMQGLFSTSILDAQAAAAVDIRCADGVRYID